MAIDVVFLDADMAELKCIGAVRPNRIVGCRRARSTIELPAGYCRQYPDYLRRIRSALRPDLAPGVSVRPHVPTCLRHPSTSGSGHQKY